MAIFGTKTENKDEKDAAVAPVLASDQQAVTQLPYMEVIIQPRVSEKAGHLAKINQYVFKVKLSANKIEVKKAVERGYNVKVVKVNIVRMKGKNRTFGRASGTTSAFKKAIVTLKEGDKIQGITETI